jgi:uncharacterized membrane protein
VTVATGVNSSGVIVGIYLDAKGVRHGFELQGSAFTTVDFPGALETDVNGIDDLGRIVGDYIDSSGVQHGFLAE